MGPGLSLGVEEFWATGEGLGKFGVRTRLESQSSETWALGATAIEDARKTPTLSANMSSSNKNTLHQPQKPQYLSSS